MAEQKDTNVKSLPEPTMLSTWQDTPANVLVEIFFYLGKENHSDVCHAGLACHSWYQVSTDELLWKELFKKRWRIGDHVPIRPGASSWREEYIRLFYHSPSILVDTKSKSVGKGPHVSSSNNGKLVATCSDYATVKVWQLQLTKPVLTLKHQSKRIAKSWMASLNSKFNKDDTKLLVVGFEYSGNGSVAVFLLSDQTMSMVTLIKNLPELMYSDWYDETSVLHGDLNMSQPSVYKSTVSKKKHTTKLCSLKNESSEGLRYMHLAVVPQPQESDVKKYLIYASPSNKYLYEDELVYHILNIVLVAGAEDDETIDAPEEHTVELAGNIVGMALSPDHKFLYVNVRKIIPTEEPAYDERGNRQSDQGNDEHPQNNQISKDHSTNVQLSQDCTMHVIDMTSKTICSEVYQGHRMFYYINMYNDVSNHYVASGSEDNATYIWDRYYRVLVARLEHDVPGCCSGCFNIKDEEIYLSVSNDRDIKVWMSRYLRHKCKNIE